MRIEDKLIFKKEGDKPASDFLKEFVKEKSKNIKLTVPFEASGKFEKTPMQLDGITPIVVNKPNFSVSGIKEEKEVKSSVEEVKYTKKELEALTFTQLKVIGNKLGIKFRGKEEAVKEILAFQNKK